jgi:KaiC/GvpD/RAD55 family RecA-like ATPase
MPKKEKKVSVKKVFERIPSGIPGLDNLMEGGFVKGSTNLVSGAAGTGKTIFCAQYLMEGLKRGEICMFITLEESPKDIIDDVRRFGWDFEKYVNDKKLFIDYQDPFQVTDITSPLLDKIKEHNIQRVAIDSTALLEMYYKDPAEVRKQLFKLLSGLKEIGVTSVVTTELPEESNTLGKFGVEEFVVDGVIVLHFLGLGEKTYFSLQVRKMRRTNHGKDVYSMEIGNKGIEIKAND